MHVTLGRNLSATLHYITYYQDMSSPMMRVISTFHVMIWGMKTPPSSWQDRENVGMIENNGQHTSPAPHPSTVSYTGYRLAAEVNRQHSGCVCIYTHTPSAADSLRPRDGTLFIYTHTPSAADSLRPRDGTQWSRRLRLAQCPLMTPKSLRNLMCLLIRNLAIIQ